MMSIFTDARRLWLFSHGHRALFLLHVALEPQGNATRAQVAVILARFFEA